MQAKVSVVITCYNKAKHIGNMFDSIIAQKWDNIELILVNDGSTDGTRSIIESYIANHVASLRFPQFYDGSVSFIYNENTLS